jgi:predicted HTH transcriptional regulator
VRAVLTDAQFAQFIALPHELRGVEFKPPGPRTDPYLFAQVTRAALGMANNPGGGTVIIGVEEHDGLFRPVGLAADALVTWRYDDVSSRFASYADPPIDFNLNIYNFDGRQFVALEIAEFSELPILCKIDYQPPPVSRDSGERRTGTPILRAGACYVRSQRKPETSEIPSQTEMRELLTLATDKGVIAYLDRARRLGLLTPANVPLTNLELYQRQRQDFGGDV